MPVSFGARVRQAQAEQAEQQHQQLLQQAARQAAPAAPAAGEELRVDVGAAQEAAPAEAAPPPPPAPLAPAPAPGRPLALVVDPKNPRTPKEDTDKIYQWVGRGTAWCNEEMRQWIKDGFSFTTKCQGGWYWFRKPWHASDARVNKHNPKSISEDVDHAYQWASNVANLDDGWSYCGLDRDGQRWFRRPWPERDSNNPRRPEDDRMLKFSWSVLAANGDNMAMIRDDWEYVGKAPQTGSNLWRKRRRVAGVLPPDAPDPERPDEVEDVRSARRRRLGPYVADRIGRHDLADDLEVRREEREAVVASDPSDDE